MEDVIKQAEKIQGWLRPEEYAILYNLVSSSILPNGKAVEIGSWHGKSSYIIGSVCKDKNAHLTCIDTFLGVEDTTPNADITNKGYFGTTENKNEFFEKNIKINLKGLPVRYIKKPSRLAHLEIPDNSVDFCFIDGDHYYEVVKQDIQNYLPKVRVGGILCGHDYADNPDDVKKAVTELLPSHTVLSSIWVHNKTW